MKKNSVPSDEIVTLDTAGGEVDVDTEIKGRIQDTGNGSVMSGDYTPKLLKSCPDVFGAGYRAMVYGQGFHWPPWSDKPFTYTCPPPSYGYEN